MPVNRQTISVSQFAELIGVDPDKFIAIEKLSSTMLAIVTEPDADQGHVSTTDHRETRQKEGQEVNGEDTHGWTQEDHGHDGHRQEVDALQLLMGYTIASIICVVWMLAAVVIRSQYRKWL